MREKKKERRNVFREIGIYREKKEEEEEEEGKKTALTFGYVEADSFLLPGGERGLQGLGHLLVGPRC